MRKWKKGKNRGNKRKKKRKKKKKMMMMMMMKKKRRKRETKKIIESLREKNKREADGQIVRETARDVE